MSETLIALSYLPGYSRSLFIYSVPSHDYCGFAPPKHFAFQFIDVLSSLTKLEKLHMNLDDAFEDLWITRRLIIVNFQKIKLPYMHTLHMIPFNPYVWKMCPNLSALSTTSATGFLRNYDHLPAAHFYDVDRLSIGGLKKLRSLRIDALGHFDLLRSKNFLLQIQDVSQATETFCRSCESRTALEKLEFEAGTLDGSYSFGLAQQLHNCMESLLYD
jgi:hypothetical protein